MRQILFVSSPGDSNISCWEIDPDNGALNFMSSSNVEGRPSPMAADIENLRLYIGRRDIPQISTYEYDIVSGRLSHHSDGAVLHSDPCYISLDKTKNYILGAYYSAGGVSVNKVVDGVVDKDIDWMPTGFGAHCVMTDVSNDYVMLPHIAGEQGINTIRSYKFDSEKGHLTPNNPSTYDQKDNRGPRHFVFHPNGKFVYFSNEQECSVTAYKYEEGRIEEIQTHSTLPMHYSGVNTCAQIRITSDGKFLYAPNRGHDSIACFSVNKSTGLLKSIGRTPTEATPRVLDVDMTGKYLYSAGLDSGYLSAFSIGDKGKLKFIDRYEVGKEPMWVLVVPGE